MALITCKKCGRSVSDTRETCIHCGTLLREEIDELEEAVSEERIATEPEMQGKEPENNFHQLSAEVQKALVWEFQRSVPEVGKHAKRFLKAQFCVIYIGGFLLLNLLLRMCEPYFVQYIRNPIMYRIVFFDFTVPILLLIWFFAVLKRNRLNSKKKKIALQKKFEYWLKKEKSITYLPEFFDLKQKQEYEQINIDSIKL